MKNKCKSRIIQQDINMNICKHICKHNMFQTEQIFEKEKHSFYVIISIL